MPLIYCPDCGNGRSDQAGSVCPHCGHQVSEVAQQVPPPKGKEEEYTGCGTDLIMTLGTITLLWIIMYVLVGVVGSPKFTVAAFGIWFFITIGAVCNLIWSSFTGKRMFPLTTTAPVENHHTQQTHRQTTPRKAKQSFLWKTVKFTIIGILIIVSIPLIVNFLDKLRIW